ncbi:UNVERIFIED_CONTAM: putative sphingolipid transporter spinster2 [Sesamum radiatum]|uniref:Sphingolipid transporter spinster2 n=1 Tax=Sesamum radiatum TaxID=300843 RepID=A0AAW2S5V1_SESRA
MARAPTSSVTNPSWFTPKRLYTVGSERDYGSLRFGSRNLGFVPLYRGLLAIFCIINLLNYIDRGTIASNGVNGSRRSCSKSGTCSSGSGIQGDFDLNNFEDGVISSAFMVGLLVASPIFASLAKSVNPFRLIGVGLTVWTLAVAFCGFSFNFWSIAISRMLVGVGEASFISLAAPFIDDNAPVAQRTAWLGTFYMCIPTGVAVGYVYGGLVGSFSWRLAFWLEAILMLPFAILGFVMKPLQLKGLSPARSKIVLTVADGCSEDQDYNLIMNDGFFLLFIPIGKDGEVSRREEDADESSKLSRLTVLTIFWKDMKVLLLEKVYVVNVLGYIAYNFVIGAYSYWGPKAGYNIYHMSNADYLFGGVTAVCGIFGTVAGGLVLDRMTSTISNAFKLLSFATFIGAIFCFAAFCFKSLYVFLALFSIGELLVFATQDHVNNWRATALILTSVLFLAAAIWFIGVFLNSVDRYNEDSENPVTPLLEEKA